MRGFLSEKLTGQVLSRCSRSIRSADLCWALKLESGSVTLPSLEEQRWQVGDAPLIESLERRLSVWADQLAASQSIGGTPLRPTDQALLAYGVWARLWAASVGTGMVRYSASQLAVSMKELDLVIAGDDPYLRDAFVHPAGIRSEVRSVCLCATKPLLPLRQRVKEKVIGNAWLRAMALALHGSLRRIRSSSLSEKDMIGKSGKVAAVFVLNQRFLDIFSPVIHELKLRGWRVLCFHYNGLTHPSSETCEFQAVPLRREGQFPVGKRLLWNLRKEQLRESPVSPAWLTAALNASWMTASTQIKRHRDLLKTRRPDVVISFGPETMSLALQSAAESLGIPSLFMAHGFLGPIQSPPGYFFAMASALFGPACVESNEKAHEGTKRKGLIATGFPPYDAMLVRSTKDLSYRPSGLDVPAERPHVVLIFATWALYPLWFSLQRKTLKMIVDALPSDAYLVCKLHPSCEEREMCEKILGAGLPGSAFRVVGEEEFSTPDLLATCKVAVANEHSMALRDAIIMGRPSIAIRDPAFPRGEQSCNPLNHPGSDFQEICWLVSNTEELRTALATLTTNEQMGSSLLQHRKDYIQRFLFASDGRSTQRVADLVGHLADGKSPDSYIPSIGESLLT